MSLLTVNNSKKYVLNFNMADFNYSTGFFEKNGLEYVTRAEALMNKWKCEKCSERFPTYRMVHDHKTQYHSY